MSLNRSALDAAEQMLANAKALHVARHESGGATVVDCGVHSRGGLEAGRRLAEVCLAAHGEVTIGASGVRLYDGPSVLVRTDEPVDACMASQYAGWQIEGEGFFAMGSGPMRAAAGREELFGRIGRREDADCAVGALESDALPPAAVCQEIAEKCSVPVDRLTLFVAPTASQAGTLQVVARSVETALHKLLEIGFDIDRVESAWGSAPLPPVAGDQLAAIGRTNDAILYGAHAVLYVRGDDESIRDIGQRATSCASPDHGRPFREIFAAHDSDFYAIDPLLFSPAVVTFVNLDTGVSSRFGRYEPNVLASSFGG